MGKRIRPDFLSQHFPDFLVAHQMKRIRFHDLRQSALCQWREPEGDSGVAGSQRYFYHGEYLRASGFAVQEPERPDDGKHADIARSAAHKEVVI